MGKGKDLRETGEESSRVYSSQEREGMASKSTNCGNIQPLQKEPSNALKSLTARPQWVAWGADKVPYSPITGGRASSTRPHTWGTYERAMAFCEQQGLAGVGYVFSRMDPYTGIDLDTCRDPTTGTIEPWAQDIITALSSYTEVSP